MFKAFNLQLPVKSAVIFLDSYDSYLGGNWARLNIEYNSSRKTSLLFPSDQAARIYFGKHIQKGVKWVSVVSVL